MTVSGQTPLLGSHRKPPYTVFSNSKKLLIILTATLASVFSPLSANIYYPALSAIQKELGISEGMLNMTITSYMIFQGLSPTFIGSLSDTIGRRPVYIVCFLIYIAANVGLIFQTTFIGLLLLRCLQSSGSSSTVNLAYGVTADVVTSAERGRYVGLASVGPIIGPTLGPIIGGAISQYYGWRYIFVVLTGLALVMLAFIVVFLPETCRNIVGNGSLEPPSVWNKPLISLLLKRKGNEDQDEIIEGQQAIEAARKKGGRPTPWKSLTLLFTHPTGCVILFNGFTFATYYAVTTSLTWSFASTYHFDEIQIGLSYIPIGLGSMLAALSNGFLLDWNYRRSIKNVLGRTLARGEHLDHETGLALGFHIERARLQIVIPAVLFAMSAMIAYGWSVRLALTPAVPLALLFAFGWMGTAAYSGMNVLIVDLNLKSPATATAANNLVRCMLGALGAMVIMPLINTIGMGWTFVVISGVWIVLSPLIMLVAFQESSEQ
ncbi:putative bicyclomycin resistance protein [Xylogone sp. PMI_703]|nr:putative bicyclomycin resistance protein [Xylogone sp. PMI_703]